ncbi:MAG: caspase family protein [Desulfobacterales bacterium]|nr:caspase family protein [Desulfobacterales bacterium]
MNEAEAIQLADGSSEPKEKLEAVILKHLPPRVTILSPSEGEEVTSKQVTLRYKVEGNLPINVSVYMDGARYDSTDSKKTRDLVFEEEKTPSEAQKAKNVEEITQQIEIPEQDVRIGLVATDRNQLESESVTINLKWKGATQLEEKMPNLFILAVGVGDYIDDGIDDLNATGNDASGFIDVLKRQEGKFYKKIEFKKLIDSADPNSLPTKQAIIDGLNWLVDNTKNNPNDYAFIFLAGHGVSDKNNVYYFVPKDAKKAQFRDTAVSFNDIKQAFYSIQCKKILFVDSCHSGDVMGENVKTDGNTTKVANELSDGNSATYVLTASTGNQTSLELPVMDEREMSTTPKMKPILDDPALCKLCIHTKNGVFTKALIEGLSGEAVFRGKNIITVKSLDSYIDERITEILEGCKTDHEQNSCGASPKLMPNFPIAKKLD